MKEIYLNSFGVTKWLSQSIQKRMIYHYIYGDLFKRKNKKLRVLDVGGGMPVPYIYKRFDVQQDLPVEERAYQVRVPVPMEKGVRKSLRTLDRTTAIERADDLVLELKSVLGRGYCLQSYC
tara:strand:- start:1149 stop:1511 length:363 start_codon:yes stop_codon:yes gene_type:complete